ncbi:FG-GAP-like repeat-containing protein [Methylobacterium aquaticum]|uniref:FG-GAP-like repeat-containing protein n=1 Tax=Methylobacterium aquaticum TaxID=270351 RepID=UPI00193406FE|nr:FG-GAP-like repeat-containing protein [Methylobacterium aquaticum]QRE75501.1 DUF4214 domain-containing protein [Methylobacterium aquaticum]
MATVYLDKKDFNASPLMFNIELADANNDGIIDLIAPSYDNNSVSILLGRGDGTFLPKQDLAAGTYTDGVTIADVNRDGINDILSSSFIGVVSASLGTGGGSFSAGAAYRLPAGGPRGILAADVNNDARVDLIVPVINPANGVFILIGNGDGTFAAARQAPAGSTVTAVVASDVNNDGNLDLFVADGDGSVVSLLLGNGDGTFRNKVDLNPRDYLGDVFGAEPMATADFNGDGKADLAVVNNRKNVVSVLLGRGDGSFEPVREFSISAGAASVSARDLDGDGAADLLVAGNAGISVLAGLGNGSFAAERNLVTTPTNAFAAADVNRDGVTDLVGVTARDTISVYLGTKVTGSSLSLLGVGGVANHVGGRSLYGTVFGAAPGASVTIRSGTTVLGTIPGSDGGFSLALPRTILDGLQGADPTLDFVATTTLPDSRTAETSLSYTFDFTPNRSLFLTHVIAPSQVQLEVYSLFDGILQRAPDVSGWEAFIRSRQGGSSLVDLAKSILDSPEFALRFGDPNRLSDSDFVRMMYQGALGRTGTSQEVEGWVVALQAGASRGEVAYGFALSAENQGQVGQSFRQGVDVPQLTSAMVSRLYYGLLDRAPDANGLANWVSGLDQNRSTLVGTVGGFLYSDEYAKLHPTGQTDAQFVSGIYENVTGHAAGADDMAMWTTALTTQSRAQVTAQIIQSGEAVTHLAGKIEQGFHLF